VKLLTSGISQRGAFVSIAVVFVLTFGLVSGHAASAAVPYTFSACLTSQGALNSVSITSGPADSRPCLKGWSSQ